MLVTVVPVPVAAVPPTVEVVRVVAREVVETVAGAVVRAPGGAVPPAPAAVAVGAGIRGVSLQPADEIGVVIHGVGHVAPAGNERSRELLHRPEGIAVDGPSGVGPVPGRA